MQYKPRNQETVEKKSMRRQDLLEEVIVDVVEDLQKGHKVYAKTLIKQYGVTKNEIKEIFLSLSRHESMKDNIRYNKSREYLEPLNNNDIFSRLAKK